MRQLIVSVQVFSPPTMPSRRSLNSSKGGLESILNETSNSPSQGLELCPLASEAFFFGRPGFFPGVDLHRVALAALFADSVFSALVVVSADFSVTRSDVKAGVPSFSAATSALFFTCIASSGPTLSALPSIECAETAASVSGGLKGGLVSSSLCSSCTGSGER